MNDAQEAFVVAVKDRLEHIDAAAKKPGRRAVSRPKA